MTLWYANKGHVTCKQKKNKYIMRGCFFDFGKTKQ